MLTGKGCWLWKLPACENGDPGAITSAAVQAGLSHVVVKVAEGVKGYNDRGQLSRLVTALHSKGVAVWGFGYSYGGSAERAAAEGDFLGKQVKALGMDGAVIDAEGEYEAHGSDAWAQACGEALKGAYAGPAALSSFWSPQEYHPTFPWRPFLSLVGCIMPQVYWGATRDAALTLRQSAAEFAPYLQANAGLQFFPTGAINQEEGGGNPQTVTHFGAEVDAEGLAGANFWVWDEAVASMWGAMAKWQPKAR
jgi:hypothetical protein